MNKTEHILVVEDDAFLAEWICDYLQQQGYTVTLATNGTNAVELILEDKPDLVLLDLMLPEKSGFDVCREVRSSFARPILMMTASGDEVDEVLGLELGADDYITKPVKPRVLLARIKLLLRRDPAPQQDQTKVRTYGAMRIDSGAKSVSLNGEDLNLSSHEFDVLWLLCTRPGQVISRTELVSELRGIDYNGFDRSIDIRVSRLRKKLDDYPQSPCRIKTVWGKGYLFAVDSL